MWSKVAQAVPLVQRRVRSEVFRKLYIIQASQFQMFVLLQFNDSESFTEQQLQESARISVEKLKEILRMLLKAKLMVVNGTDESASDTNLASDTIVSVYADCNSKKLKVNINP